MYPIEYATISAPTPETISIIITLSGSTRTDRPDWYEPPSIHVHAVEMWCRSCGCSPRRPANAVNAPANATAVDSVETYAAVRREMRVPASVITSAPTSGESRQIHAPAVKSPSAPKRVHAVDVERDVLAIHRYDETEADDDLRRGDGHHGDREDLPGAVAQVPRVPDQREVPAVQHDLEREQDDDRVSQEEDAERAGREQERGDAQVPGDIRSEHVSVPPHQPGRVLSARSASLPALPRCSRRAGAPRMTPLTAATSSTLDVTSNASRWSVRNRRPISAGLPKACPSSAEWASPPLALSPTTTMI